MRLLFVTTNALKLTEAKAYLKDHIVDNYSVKLPELQGTSAEIIKKKADYALKVLNKPLFVEDTALYFRALKGLPGPYIAEFIKNLTLPQIVKLLSAFKDKRAKATCTIAFARPEREIRVFEGAVHGKIVTPMGRKKYSWDPIFLPNGHDKTYAQMSLVEKNRISQRKKALQKFNNYLSTSV